MARTKQFDETQALVSAMRVFWEKGYEGTSIHDLEQAMGLNRTSIYNTFGNKRAIFNRVMSCYKESVMASLFAALDTYIGPIYLAAGMAEGGGTNFYLFIGAPPR